MKNVMNINQILMSSETAMAVPITLAGETGVKVCKLDGDYPFHAHDVDEVFVILEGALTMDYDGEGSHPLKAGDVLRVPAGQRHRTRTDTPSKVLLVGPQ